MIGYTKQRDTFRQGCGNNLWFGGEANRNSLKPAPLFYVTLSL